EKGITLKLDINDNLIKEVTGDPTRTGQVINNLIHNAIKFTKEGWVCLSIKVVTISDEFITMKISVQDTGIGIELGKQLLIFERFTQADSSTSRSYGGTGLGLAISKKILELQGITLQLQSETNKGSIFYFTQTFPVSKEKASAQQLSLRTNETNNQRLKG